MSTFKQKLLVEYPIPSELSIWGGDGKDLNPIEDLNLMIETCMEELGSDLYMTEYIESSGITTQLPDDTIMVTSAKLKFPFQGNRLVKVTYDASTKRAFLRYYPAIITYRRKLRLQDLDKLSGDFLIYMKSYTLWKMSDKELQILNAVDLDADNGKINLSILQKFSDQMKERYKELKPEITLYATVN